MVFVSQLRACDFVCLCLMVRVTICIYMCVCLCNIYWRTSFDVPVMLLICCVASSSSSSSLIGCKRKNLLLWGEEDGQKDRGRSFVWNPWWQWPTDFVFKWKKKTNSNSKNHLTLRQLFLRGQQFVEGAHGYRAEPSYRHSCLNPLSTIRPKYYPLTFLNTCTHHSAAPPPPFLFFLPLQMNIVPGCLVWGLGMVTVGVCWEVEGEKWNPLRWKMTSMFSCSSFLHL